MRKTLDKSQTCISIKDKCWSKNLGAEKLAALLDVSVQTVYSWFSGIKKTTIEHMVELADILEVSIDEIIKTHILASGNSPPTCFASQEKMKP